MSVNDNKALIADFMAEFSKKDNFDVWSEYLADTATWWIIGNPVQFPAAGTKSKLEFVNLIKSLSSVVPAGIQFMPRRMIGEGDFVAVEAESFADTISGKKYHNRYHLQVEVRDNKIQSVKEYLDTMHVMDVLMS